MLLGQRQKAAVILLSLATLFSNSLDIIAIAMLGAVGALALSEESLDTFSWLPAVERPALIVGLLSVAGLIFTVKTVTGVFLARIRHKFLANQEVRASEVITSHLFLRDLTAVKQYSRSHIEWSILRSTEYAFGRVLGQALVLFSEVSLAFLIIIFFIFADPLSAALVIAYFSLVLILFQLFATKQSGSTGQDIADGAISFDQAIGDTLVAYREATVLGKIQFFSSRIIGARKRVANAQALQSYMAAIPRLIVELALIIGALGFLGFQLFRTNGDPDFSLISVFIVGSLRMMSAMLPLQRAYMQLKYVAPQANISQEMLRTAAAVVPLTISKLVGLNTKKDNWEGGISVIVQNLSFDYADRPNTEPTLREVSMEIPSGSTIAIIGPSGAGKSTLVDLILGLQSPSHGNVICSGYDPAFLRTSVPGIMGYVPQKPGIVAGNILDNIALGVSRDEVDFESLESAIEIANIRDFVESLPEGLHSNLGSQADALSGGQIQRIGLARALYSKPKLLVLDEATSSLDAETEASITESLERLGSKVTKIIVAHRLSTVQHVDKVFVLDSGAIVAAGKLKDLERTVPIVKKYMALMKLQGDPPNSDDGPKRNP